MSEIAQAFVRIRPSTTGFKAEAERDVKRGLGGIGKVIGGAFAAVGLEEGVRKVAEAAASQQEELSVVRQAIKSTSSEWEVHGQTVDKILREQAVKFGFTVSDLAQGFTRIQVSTKDSAKTLSLLDSAMDIARARHLGLAQAAVIEAKAQAGNVTGLQRLGIVIPKVTDNYDSLKKRVDEARAGGAKFTKEQELQIKGSYDRAKALDAEATKLRINSEIQQRFGGQSANFARTAEGSSERFHEAVNELEVAVGNGLLPTLTKAAAGATTLFKELADGGQVEAFAAGSARELASAYDLVVGIAKEIAPPLTAAAKAVGTLAHAAGGGGIVAFVAGYKALGLAIGIAEKARLRYTAVVAAGTGQAAAEAAAANTSTNATVRRTAATVASADAVEAESIALAKNVDAMLASQAVAARLADEQAALAAKYEITNVAAFGGGKLIRDASGQFVTSTAKVDAFANSAERAGSKLGNLSRGLFALAGGWTTVAAVGLGAAAFGIYKLVTADSALEQANQRVMDSQRNLDATLQNSALLRQRLAALNDAVPDERLGVARAKLNEEEAKNALLTSQAAKGSAAYRNLQLGVLEAIQNRRRAEKQLNDTVDARTKTENAQSFNDRRRTREARDAADSIAANARAINAAHERSARAGMLRRGVPADPTSPGLIAALLRARQAAAAEFARKTDQTAENEKNKTIRRNDELIAAYARQFKKTPSPPLIRFILDNKNAKASLRDLLADFRNTGRTGALAAHAQGEHIGREYGAGLKAGMDGSTAAAVAASRRLAHRIAEEAKLVLGIRSPSEVMRREVGEPIAQGIAAGMDDGIAGIGSRFGDSLSKLIGSRTRASQSGRKIGAEMGASVGGGLAEGIRSSRGGVQRELAEMHRRLFVLPGKNPGLVEAGNIDLLHRKVARTRDGGIATVKSFSIGTDKGETLLPSVIDGKIVSLRRAIAEYERTGKNLGTFNSPKSADAYAERLHREQAVVYAAAIRRARAGGKSAGHAYSEGVGVGILDMAKSGFSAVETLLGSVIQHGKDKIGARSPSEVARRGIGHAISDGIALGILDRNGAVVGSITNQVDQAIAAGIQSVRDAVVSAKQNLNSIGSSLSSDIGTLLDKRKQTGSTATSTPAQDARLHALLQQIHSGQGGQDTVRLAQAISNQVVQHASVAQATTSTDNRAERIQRRIADLTDLLNRGSIRSEAVFDRRLNSILKGAGIGSGFGRSSLGVAFADQLRADVQGLRDQAHAILQGPRVKGTGLEPQIVKPLDAIKAAQQQIADAAREQRQAQLAEAKRQTAEAKKHTKHLKDIADHTKGTATTKDVASWINWAEKHPKAAADALVATNTRHGHGG